MWERGPTNESEESGVDEYVFEFHKNDTKVKHWDTTVESAENSKPHNMCLLDNCSRFVRMSTF
jgi:hypothetical protein